MPSATMRTESEYRLPEDVIFPAKLMAVTSRTIEFVHKKGDKIGQKGSFDKWEWEFLITEGEYAGQKAYGSTEAVLNNLPEPRGNDKLVRPWAETLLGRQIQPGERFDTEQVVGLPCLITVRHEEPRPKSNGGTYYGCPVEDVFPAPSAAQSPSAEPPF